MRPVEINNYSLPGVPGIHAWRGNTNRNRAGSNAGTDVDISYSKHPSKSTFARESNRYSYDDASLESAATAYTPDYSDASSFTEYDDLEDEKISSVFFTNPFSSRGNTGLSSSAEITALLTLWHMLMLVLSLTFLAAGIAIRFYFSYWVIKQVNGLHMFQTYSVFMSKADENNTQIRFSGYEQIIGTILMISHSLYTISHILYVTYQIHRFQYTLPMASLITGCVALGEISVINVFLSPDIIARQDVVENLQEQLLKYTVKSDDNFIISYQYISVWLKCCGITDRWDFQDIAGFVFKSGTDNSTITTSLLEVAPTCCKREVFTAGPDRVLQCAHKTELDIGKAEHYNIGCFSFLVDIITLGCNYYAIIIWIHLADVAIHSSVYKQRVSSMAAEVGVKSGEFSSTNRQRRKVKTTPAFMLTRRWGKRFNSTAEA
ncbi:hypothetical protein RRG08_031996 [Elysia crispata]|uniref:Uncharacterized protein n=1 Tax=Elysia crispata TaxID=231223 RepID=A0AAE1A4W2_9GAST|nr:hypothetical protein RRG08_031996 [Elysia crispata]